MYGQPQRVPELNSVVLAVWEPDGYYYVGYLVYVHGEEGAIVFYDGGHAWVPMQNVIGLENLSAMRLEGNWEKRGYYYACDLLSKDENFNLYVRYQEDGVEEWITLAQLRARY